MEPDRGHMPVRRLYLLSQNELLIWTVTVCISGIWGYLTRGPNWGGDIGTFVNCVNMISSALASGIPVFLAAGLMFSTSSSRGYIMELISDGLGCRKVVLLRFLQCSVLIAVYSVALTAATSVVSLASTQMDGMGFLVYLPSVLVASLVVSFLLGAIAVLLALASDNAVISTALGSAATMAISFIAGWNATALSGSVTRTLALMSPHNLFRTLAAILSGYDFAAERNETMYFGITISPQGVFLSLFCFSLLALGAIVAAVPVLRVDLGRWSVLHEMVQSSEIWPASSDAEDPARAKTAVKSLGLQRTLVAFAVISLLMSMGIGTAVYGQGIVAGTSVTHYESPENGEGLPLGVWFVIEFDMPPPYPGLSNLLWYHMRVLDWGDCPDELSYCHAFQPMTSTEFQLLDESSKMDLCSEPGNRTRGNWGGVSAYGDLGEEHGTHILVFHVVAAENASLSGTLWVHLEIWQRSG